jgi:hypothetical protein
MSRQPAFGFRAERRGGRNKVGDYHLSALEQRIADDLDWAQTAPEVQTHQGQLVAVRNKKVLAIGRERRAVVRQAAQREHCAEEELTVVIVPAGGPWEVPS